MFTVHHHGTSGTWYPLHGPAGTFADALVIADALKREGYGVRIVDDAGEVVVFAPWQEPVCPFGESEPDCLLCNGFDLSCSCNQ